MRFTSAEEAMRVFGKNLDWENSTAQAKNALHALRYLKTCRPQSLAHMNSNITFSEIDNLITKIEELVDRKNRLSWTSARPRFL